MPSVPYYMEQVIESREEQSHEKLNFMLGQWHNKQDPAGQLDENMLLLGKRFWSREFEISRIQGFSLLTQTYFHIFAVSMEQHTAKCSLL